MTDVADHAGRPQTLSILKWDAAAFSYIRNNRIDNVPDPMPGEMIPHSGTPGTMSDTSVRINAGIEEAYRAGHTGNLDVSALDYGTTPERLLLSDAMINACAANHWARGVDGLYVFNWQCKTWEGNRLKLDNLGHPQRLECRDKLYAVTRRDGQYPYCDLQARPVPAWLGPEQLELPIRVADDLTAAADRLESCRLCPHLIDAAEDDIETLNSTPPTCANPLVRGTNGDGDLAPLRAGARAGAPRRQSGGHPTAVARSTPAGAGGGAYRGGATSSWRSATYFPRVRRRSSGVGSGGDGGDGSDDTRA